MILMICLMLFLAITSFALLIKVQALHERCITILVVAYDWLEKARLKEEHEVVVHEGTD